MAKTAGTSATHQQWLLELTTLPTAAGREGRVMEWVQRWAKQRGVVVARDRYGNLTLSRKGTRAAKAGAPGPIYITAHMDHPAFVVTNIETPTRVEAAFRGGVNAVYFVGSPVLLYHGEGEPQRGKVVELDNQPSKEKWGQNDGAKRVIVEFEAAVNGVSGDVMTWDTGKPRVEGDRLFVPACDDLAGVAAALSAFDVALSRKGLRSDVKVFLTRAEEVGFVGAIAACKAKTIPKNARVIALENSKSYAESPIGDGPIVRVGDYTSTFDPDLTYRIGRIAQDITADDASFKWQRKLMPGGTCEASAYQTYGYTATCVCLPLGNYHNMNEATQRIDAETISLADYHGLVRLLVAVIERLDDPSKAPPLRKRLDELFDQRRSLLAE